MALLMRSYKKIKALPRKVMPKKSLLKPLIPKRREEERETIKGLSVSEATKKVIKYLTPITGMAGAGKFGAELGELLRKYIQSRKETGKKIRKYI